MFRLQNVLHLSLQNKREILKFLNIVYRCRIHCYISFSDIFGGLYFWYRYNFIVMKYTPKRNLLSAQIFALFTRRKINGMKKCRSLDSNTSHWKSAPMIYELRYLNDVQPVTTQCYMFARMHLQRKKRYFLEPKPRKSWS